MKKRSTHSSGTISGDASDLPSSGSASPAIQLAGRSASARNKGGRPAVDLDENAVGDMALAGCTNKEIAAYSQCSEDTIERRFGGFAGVLAKKRAERKWHLRDAQYQHALAGNATLLIFLGKTELGQLEAPPIDSSYLEKCSDDELRAIASGRVPRLRVE